jgi:hypothetical protein
MKLKISLVIVIAALVTFGLSGAAFAFHNGGVAACESCHTMHNSKGGAVMSKSTSTTGQTAPNFVIGQAGPYLLQGSDGSSTCLNCHGSNSTSAGSYKVLSYNVTVPVQRTPGGDFGWLRKSSTKGHSIVAADYGFGAETKKAGNVAPGGNYPVGSLGCASCHDPHGRFRKLSNGNWGTTGEPIAGSGSYGADPTNGEAVGAYRLLGGAGYFPVSAGATYAFTANPMSAASPNPYNQSEALTEVVVNYGDGGVGQWCAQCHAKMHMNVTNGAINVHPNDQALGANVSGIYNNYVKTGNMGGGAGSGYTSLIPVAYDNINTNSALLGHFTTGAQVTSNDRVMCLSCHRAHASGFDYMLRFPIVEVMTIDDGTGAATYWKGGTNAATVSLVSGLTVAEMQAALYDRPASNFAVEQRALCNKCHGKD